MTRTIFVAVMLVAASASAFELSPPVQTGPAEFAGAPRIATDGRSYLAVWGDERPRPTYKDAPAAIRAMFLDADGRPRADRDFEIVPAPAVEKFESSYSIQKQALGVASNGHGYLVAYSKLGDTQFVHVSDDGKIRPGTDVADGRLHSFVAWRGYYAAAVFRRSAYACSAAVLLVDSRGVIARERCFEAEDIDLFAAADGRLLLATRDDSGTRVDIAFMTLSEFLDPRFPGPAVRSSIDVHEESFVSIAESNGRFVTATASTSSVWLHVLDAQGAIVRQQTREHPELRFNRTIVAAKLGSGFVLVGDRVRRPETEESTALAALRLSNDLEAQTTAFETLSYDTIDPAVVPTRDGGVTLAYSNYNAPCCVGGYWAARVQRLSPAGERLLGPDGVAASRHLPTQEHAVVQQGGDVFVAAWVDRWADRSRVSLRRFTGGGIPLDPPNRVIDSPSNSTQSDLALACGRDTVLLTWWEHGTYRRTLAFVSLRNESVVLRSMAGADGRPVFDGERFAVFSGTFNGPSVMSRWDESGAMLGSRSFLEKDGLFQRALSWSGSSFYRAWEEEQVFRGRIMARRLDSDFNAAGPDIELAPEPRGGPFYSSLRVASDPDGGAMAAWMLCEPATGCEPRTARIHRDGLLVDTLGGTIRGSRQTLYTDNDHYAIVGLEWTGAAYELLTETAVTAIATDGRTSTHRFALGPDAHVVAMSSDGDRRLLIYWQRDAVSGMKRLHGVFVAGPDSDFGPSRRRRAARH